MEKHYILTPAGTFAVLLRRRPRQGPRVQYFSRMANGLKASNLAAHQWRASCRIITSGLGLLLALGIAGRTCGALAASPPTANWPQFRGANGSGVAVDGSPPVNIGVT